MPKNKRYYNIVRPADIATQPRGFVDMQAWFLMQEIPDDPSGLTAYGYVEYTTELTASECWRYQLRPADARERAILYLYLDHDRDLTKVYGFVKRWITFGIEKVEAIAKRDDRDGEVARAVLIIDNPDWRQSA